MLSSFAAFVSWSLTFIQDQGPIAVISADATVAGLLPPLLIPLVSWMRGPAPTPSPAPDPSPPPATTAVRLRARRRIPRLTASRSRWRLVAASLLSMSVVIAVETAALAPASPPSLGYPPAPGPSSPNPPPVNGSRTPATAPTSPAHTPSARVHSATSAPPAPTSATPRPSHPAQTRTYTLPATKDDWTATGLLVHTGEPLNVTSTGTYYWNIDLNAATPDPAQLKTPNGSACLYYGDPAVDAQWVASNKVQCFAVVAKIGPTGVPFFVGTSLRRSAPGDGELFLAINIRLGAACNRGSLTATVTAG